MLNFLLFCLSCVSHHFFSVSQKLRQIVTHWVYHKYWADYYTQLAGGRQSGSVCVRERERERADICHINLYPHVPACITIIGFRTFPIYHDKVFRQWEQKSQIIFQATNEVIIELNKHVMVKLDWCLYLYTCAYNLYTFIIMTLIYLHNAHPQTWSVTFTSRQSNLQVQYNNIDFSKMHKYRNKIIFEGDCVRGWEKFSFNSKSI